MKEVLDAIDCVKMRIGLTDLITVSYPGGWDITLLLQLSPLLFCLLSQIPTVLLFSCLGSLDFALAFRLDVLGILKVKKKYAKHEIAINAENFSSKISAAFLCIRSQREQMKRR